MTESNKQVGSDSAAVVGSGDDRHNREGDWEALQFFTAANLSMSPEEYAARHAHEWGCFSLHLCRFRDEVLGAWVRRFGEVFSDADELERCRQQLLTPDELAEVRRQEAEGF